LFAGANERFLNGACFDACFLYCLPRAVCYSRLSNSGTRAMKRIPIKAAQHIAEIYGYDQVMIYARKVGEDPAPHGEHMTTYGVNKDHCDAMARIGTFLKTKIMGWADA
jgi:hypothetical protein